MAGTAERASRQTNEVLDQVVAGLRMGLPLKRVFRIAGVGERTGHTWRSQGWKEIDDAGADADGELSFRARFAIAVEAALVDFMAPLVQRINEAAQGEGGKGGDAWKAAKELLAMRFPDEWSERTHVAKSQKMEVSGAIDHNHYSAQLENMTIDELRDESERHDAVIYAGLSGGSLDREIAKLERQLAELCKSRDRESEIASRPRGKYSTGPAGGRYARPPLELGSTEFDREDNKIQAAVLQAPDTAEGPGVVARPSATPHVYEDPRPTGIGYGSDGLAFYHADEDTKL